MRAGTYNVTALHFRKFCQQVCDDEIWNYIDDLALGVRVDVLGYKVLDLASLRKPSFRRLRLIAVPSEIYEDWLIPVDVTGLQIAESIQYVILGGRRSAVFRLWTAQVSDVIRRDAMVSEVLLNRIRVGYGATETGNDVVTLFEGVVVIDTNYKSETRHVRLSDSAGQGERGRRSIWH